MFAIPMPSEVLIEMLCLGPSPAPHPSIGTKVMAKKSPKAKIPNKNTSKAIQTTDDISGAQNRPQIPYLLASCTSLPHREVFRYQRITPEEGISEQRVVVDTDLGNLSMSDNSIIYQTSQPIYPYKKTI